MEESKTMVRRAFTLPNEKVTVKFIPRKIGMAAEVADNHVIAGGMLTNSVKRFFAPLKKTGGIKNVLTNEEKEYLENLTNLNLSVYGDFWSEFSVKLYKEDTNNMFDLSDPMEYISIKILESIEDEIANSWNERFDKTSYMFAITRDSEITNEKKEKFDTKKEAWKAYGKIENDRDKIISILKLMTNTAISEESDLEWVQGQLEEKVDSQPQSFLDIIQDPSFETKVLINKGISKKIIIKRGNKYATSDGLELAESGAVPVYENVIKYLEDDRNQDVRSLIEAKIDKA